MIPPPGRVAWAPVYGYRHVSNNRFNPRSPIALRRGFREEEPETFKRAYALLSGAGQA